MRLIHTTRLEFKDFLGSYIPKHAILSHCWGDDEVSYQDFLAGRKLNSAGYKKITDCCRLALEHNLRWAWVDTCCIDKTSSAELSEAINSMFAWYNKSTICFAFLPEKMVYTQPQQQGQNQRLVDHSCTVPGHRGNLSTVSSGDLSAKFCTACFHLSRYWTRGWTLQELLAPREVLFFDGSLAKIGNTTQLEYNISVATGIDREYLEHGAFNRASVACRMSWAASRRTSRTEDVAYCLLGLFGVNMPLLYGEGTRAFLRLQQHIFDRIPDESLFAWSWPEDVHTRGIFARHPSEFADSKSIVPIPRAVFLPLHRITNRGIEFFYSAAWFESPTTRAEIVVPLACRDIARNSQVVTLRLWRDFSETSTMSRLWYRIDCQRIRHRRRPHPLLQLLLPSSKKVYISAEGNLLSLITPRTPDSIFALGSSFFEEGILMGINMLSLCVPAILPILLAYRRFDRGQSVFMTSVLVWFLLTLGLIASRNKVLYLGLVLIMLVSWTFDPGKEVALFLFTLVLPVGCVSSFLLGQFAGVE